MAAFKKRPRVVIVLVVSVLLVAIVGGVWYALGPSFIQTAPEPNLPSSTPSATPSESQSSPQVSPSASPIITSPANNPTSPTPDPITSPQPTKIPQTTVTFDFDTGSPVLTNYRSTPFDQSKDGVTAQFSSPGVGLFSVQSYDTKFIKLSQLIGHYLENKSPRDVLEIKFSQQLTSISFTFATYESHGAPDQASSITLTAYMDSATSTPVGSSSAHGVWPSGGDAYPQGTLNYNSGGQPFNLVRIELPYQGRAAYFAIDKIVVMTM